MACTSCHPSDAYSLEVARRFSENLWTLAVVPPPESPLTKDVWRILLTLTHVRCEKSVLFLGSFFLGEMRLVTIRKAGWAPEPVGRGGEQGNSFPSWGSYRGHSACC